MKLRIRGSSIRLRLTKPEVDALRTTGLVEEAAEFPGGARLRYAIAVEGSRVTASFDARGLVVQVPRERADAWCASNEVGVSGEEGPTRILIEKDWACVQPRSEEDPAEMFENPRGK
jgi:hypothetical protein